MAGSETRRERPGGEVPPHSRLNVFVLNVVLALAWGFVTGNFTLLNLFIGYVLAFIALWVPRELWQWDTRYFRRVWLLLRLFVVFLYELAVSGLTVAKLVLTPGLRFRSGILAIPLEAKHDLEIMLFANLISLTPGTLSLDVSDDRRTLYVHAMATDDPEGDKTAMKTAFEDNIREALE